MVSSSQYNAYVLLSSARASSNGPCVICVDVLSCLGFYRQFASWRQLRSDKQAPGGAPYLGAVGRHGAVQCALMRTALTKPPRHASTSDACARGGVEFFRQKTERLAAW